MARQAFRGEHERGALQAPLKHRVLAYVRIPNGLHPGLTAGPR